MADGGAVAGGTSANRSLKGVDATRAAAIEAQGVESALCIDYLTFGADLVCTVRNTADGMTLAMLESAIAHNEHVELIARHLHAYYFAGSPGITLDTEQRGFKNFYETHFRLHAEGGQQVGYIAFGGEKQRGKFSIELTGAGCAHVSGWAQLRAKLESTDARITRCDVAFDDFRGQHTLDDARAMHAAGLFTTNGRPPALGEQGWSDESGWTVYIGKNRGNQQLCVYEKGKQLGDPASRWVRWEARFGAKYRAIPLDILTNPEAYFRGHYPALEFVVAVAQRMATHVKRAQATLVKAMHWCKHQYGGLLGALRIYVSDERDFVRVVDSLSRSGMPKRLAELPHAAISRPAAVHLLMAAGATT